MPEPLIVDYISYFSAIWQWIAVADNWPVINGESTLGLNSLTFTIQGKDRKVEDHE